MERLRLLAEATRSFGRLDILVNNAGVYEFAPLEAVTGGDDLLDGLLLPFGVAHEPPQRAACLGQRRPRKSRIAAAIAAWCVSSAKCPVSKNLTSAFGSSRLNASAPDGRKNGSFLPHTARSGGCHLRKYSWNFG